MSKRMFEATNMAPSRQVCMVWDNQCRSRVISVKCSGRGSIQRMEDEQRKTKDPDGLWSLGFLSASLASPDLAYGRV